MAKPKSDTTAMRFHATEPLHDCSLCQELFPSSSPPGEPVVMFEASNEASLSVWNPF